MRQPPLTLVLRMSCSALSRSWPIEFTNIQPFQPDDVSKETTRHASIYMCVCVVHLPPFLPDHSNIEVNDRLYRGKSKARGCLHGFP